MLSYDEILNLKRWNTPHGLQRLGAGYASGADPGPVQPGTYP